MLETDCPFCDIFDIGTSPNWQSLFGDNDSGEVIASSYNYSVVYDTSPLVEGHLLLISNEHYPSMAAIPDIERDEFREFRERTLELLISRYGWVTLAEHGAADFAHNAGACVDHAHLHLVPGAHPIAGAIRRDYPNLVSHDDWDTLVAGFVGKPYVATQVTSDAAYAAHAPACATQYLRRLLARSSNAAERWNWRDCMRWRDRSTLTRDIEAARTLLVGRR